MLFALPDPQILYQALLDRDPSYDGHVFVGVTSTGIFCRLSCPARKPKFENSRFFDHPSACLEAGFRPCQRCRPLDFLRRKEKVVAQLLDCLDQRPDHFWCEGDLVAMDLDPSTVRRAFKRHIGMTFLDLARLRRKARGLDTIASGHSVMDAQLDAGYQSGSGFREAIIRLIGDSPAHLKNRDLLKADWLETPIGTMLAVADRHHLHLLEFSERKGLPNELKKLRLYSQAAISFGRFAPIDQIETELQHYFTTHGASKFSGFNTPLALHAPPFTRMVWDQLLQIPLGQTRTYAELAALSGRPTAIRAVANANGANQLAIIIPCHRTIGSDGTLTGYGGGLWRKRWLLEHEKRMAAQAQPL